MLKTSHTLFLRQQLFLGSINQKTRQLKTFLRLPSLALWHETFFQLFKNLARTSSKQTRITNPSGNVYLHSLIGIHQTRVFPTTYLKTNRQIFPGFFHLFSLNQAKKFFKKNLIIDLVKKPSNKSYVQALKSNIKEIFKIEDIFPKLSLDKVSEIYGIMNKLSQK